MKGSGWGRKRKSGEAHPHGGFPTDSPLQTKVRTGRFLKGKAESVHVQLFRGLGGIGRGEISTEGPFAGWLFYVVAEEPELYIRHRQPIQR